MKKLLIYCSAVMLGVAACSTHAYAQTNDTTPAPTIADQFHTGVTAFADNVTQATNWDVHVQAMYFDALKEHYGIKAGFDYLVAPMVHATLSLMLHDGTLYGMSGTFTIKKSINVGKKGNLRLTLAGSSGVGETVSGLKFGSFTVPGKSINSGEFFGEFGTHIVFSFPNWKYVPDVIVGYGKMSNLSGNIYSGGLHWPLHVFTDLL